MGCLISCFRDAPDKNLKNTEPIVYYKKPKKSEYDDPYPEFFEPFYTNEVKYQNKVFKNKYKVI
jgi:hypothetical protein